MVFLPNLFFPFIKFIASEKTIQGYNKFSISPENGRIVLSSSYFLKHKNPIYGEGNLSYLYVVDTMFDQSIGKSIEINNKNCESLISLCCFYKPSNPNSERTTGLYICLYGKCTNFSQISMTRFIGNGHTSILANQASASVNNMNQTNDIFREYCGPCFASYNNIINFMSQINLSSRENRICFEINNGIFDVKFWILNKIATTGPIIFAFNSPSLRISDSYFFENTGYYDLYTTNIITERLYSDVEIPALSPIVGAVPIENRINKDLAYFCRIGPRCSFVIPRIRLNIYLPTMLLVSCGSFKITL